jgi:hypothetical protein
MEEQEPPLALVFKSHEVCNDLENWAQTNVEVKRVFENEFRFSLVVWNLFYLVFVKFRICYELASCVARCLPCEM